MRRTRPTALAALVAVALSLVAACGSMRRPRPAASSDAPVVIFENQSLAEAAVYAVPRGGSPVRIGTVQAGRTATLTVSGTALAAGGSVTIIARLLAMSRTPTTGQLTLLPGDRIAVTLPADARLLSVLPAVP